MVESDYVFLKEKNYKTDVYREDCMTKSVVCANDKTVTAIIGVAFDPIHTFQ